MTETSLTERAKEQRRSIGLADHPTRDVDPVTGRPRVSFENVRASGANGIPIEVTTWTPGERQVLGSPEEHEDFLVPKSERVLHRAKLLDPIVAESAEMERYRSARQQGFRHVFRFGTSEYADGRDDK